MTTLFDAPIVLLDLETTGLDPKEGHRIVEIATWRLTLMRNLRLIAPTSSPYDARINVGIDDERGKDRVPAGAVRVHGLTRACLRAEGVDQETAFKPLLDLPSETIFVAHNAPFDRSFLTAELLRLEGSWWGPLLQRVQDPRSWICTLRWLYHLRPLEPSFSLGAVYARLAEGQRTRLRLHRATDDVIALRRVLQSLISQHAHEEDPKLDFARLHAYVQAVPTKLLMTSGKHKGLPIGKLPTSYLSWIARTPDAFQGRPDLRAILLDIHAERGGVR